MTFPEHELDLLATKHRHRSATVVSIMASAAAISADDVRCLHAESLASGRAVTVAPHNGFWIAVADTRDADLALLAAGGFANRAHAAKAR